MSENKNRFDLKTIIGNLKSIINPVGNTPDPSPDDAIGIKLAEFSVMAQKLQETHIEQSKRLSELNSLANDIYKHLEESRTQVVESDKKPDSTQATESQQDEKQKKDSESAE